MKKYYNEPEIELIKFSALDVLAFSEMEKDPWNDDGGFGA